MDKTKLGSLRERAIEIMERQQDPNGEFDSESWYWTHEHLSTFARDVLELIREADQS